MEWLRVLEFQMQFIKTNIFDKNKVEMIFKLFSKYFYTLQNQEKKFRKFSLKKHIFFIFDNDIFNCYYLLSLSLSPLLVQLIHGTELGKLYNTHQNSINSFQLT